MELIESRPGFDDYIEIEGDGYIQQIPVDVVDEIEGGDEIEQDDIEQGLFEVELHQQPTKPSGDFLEEARRLVSQGQAKNMTEAMKKVADRNPALHEAFKARSREDFFRRKKMRTALMSPNQKQKELIRLFDWRSLAVKQAVNAIKEGRHSIADGVVDYIKQTRPLIEELVEDNEHSPSVAYRIKELFKKQREYLLAFKDAIETNSATEAKTVMNWLLDVDNELQALA